MRDRALKNPEELDDIRQQNIDLAEEGLFTLMRSKNEMIRFKSIELFLKCQGRDRGWVQKIEADLKIEPVYKLENLSDEQLIQFTELQQKLIEKDAAPEDSQ